MRDLTPREKLILGGVAAMAVLTFFPWVSVSFGGDGEMGEMFKQLGGGSITAGNGFNSTWGVIAFLAAVATAGLVLADRAGALPWPAPKRLLAPLVSAAVAMLCLLITFGQLSGQETPFASVGRSIWFYLAVVAMGFATFHVYQRWVEGSKATPTENAPPPPPAI